MAQRAAYYVRSGQLNFINMTMLYDRAEVSWYRTPNEIEEEELQWFTKVLILFFLWGLLGKLTDIVAILYRRCRQAGGLGNLVKEWWKEVVDSLDLMVNGLVVITGPSLWRRGEETMVVIE